MRACASRTDPALFVRLAWEPLQQRRRRAVQIPLVGNRYGAPVRVGRVCAPRKPGYARNARSCLVLVEYSGRLATSGLSASCRSVLLSDGNVRRRVQHLDIRRRIPRTWLTRLRRRSPGGCRHGFEYRRSRIRRAGARKRRLCSPLSAPSRMAILPHFDLRSHSPRRYPWAERGLRQRGAARFIVRIATRRSVSARLYRDRIEPRCSMYSLLGPSPSPRVPDAFRGGGFVSPVVDLLASRHTQGHCARHPVVILSRFRDMPVGLSGVKLYGSGPKYLPRDDRTNRAVPVEVGCRSRQPRNRARLHRCVVKTTC
jgi:hypothetical protein